MKKLIFICVFFVVACGNVHDENKTGQAIQKSDTIQTVHEPGEMHGASLVFDLPIKKGSYLEQQREDNADYPADFQGVKGSLYILSSEEKKILRFDQATKQFFNYEKIHQRLLTEKEHNSVSSPIFLRVTNDHIVVGYDFKLLVFSLNQDFLYKTTFKTALQYITVKGSELNLWFYDYAEQLNLEKRNDSQKVAYGNKSIDFAGIKIHDSDKLSTDLSIYSIEGGSLNVIQIKYTPYHILPEMKKESFSLNCITPGYYVWYPWAAGNKVILINKTNGSEKTMDLGLDVTRGSLSYAEDREDGLKVVNEGDSLYFMVMKNINDQKMISVYRMEIK